jgi:hypothetical protein
MKSSKKSKQIKKTKQSKKSKISKLSKKIKKSKTSKQSKISKISKQSKKIKPITFLSDIAKMDEGLLKKFKYTDIKHLSKTWRKIFLRHAIEKLGVNKVYRRLILLRTLNKNKDKEMAKILNEDIVWIKETKTIMKE